MIGSSLHADVQLALTSGRPVFFATISVTRRAESAIFVFSRPRVTGTVQSFFLSLLLPTMQSLTNRKHLLALLSPMVIMSFAKIAASIKSARMRPSSQRIMGIYVLISDRDRLRPCAGGDRNMPELRRHVQFRRSRIEERRNPRCHSMSPVKGQT